MLSRIIFRVGRIEEAFRSRSSRSDFCILPFTYFFFGIFFWIRQRNELVGAYNIHELLPGGALVKRKRC